MPFFDAPVLLTSLPSEMSILSHSDMFALSLQTIKKKHFPIIMIFISIKTILTESLKSISRKYL